MVVRIMVLVALFAALFKVYPVAEAQVPPGVGAVFSEPAIEDPQLSPDGTRLMFIRRPQPGDEDKDQAQLFIVDYSDMEAPIARQLPADAEGLRWAAWANNDRVLLSWNILADIEGPGALVYNGQGGISLIRQVWRTVLLAMDADGSNVVQLLDQNRRSISLYQTQMDRVVDFLPGDPEHVLLAVRSSRGALNVHRVNVNSGEDRRIDRGRAETLAWFTNSAGESVMRLDASARFDRIHLLIRERDGYRWRRVATNQMSDFGEFQDGVDWVARTDAYDEALVLTRANNADTLGLHRYSLTEGEVIGPVFETPVSDVNGVRVDPFTGRALALAWADEQTYVEVFDPAVARHLDALRTFFGDDVVVEPMQRAGTRILIGVSGPTEPQSFYLYDTQAYNIVPVGVAQPALQYTALADVSVHRYRASDGTALFGYVTHPVDPEPGPLALVVMPHGGPEARDFNQFDALAQLVAAEGFMVFQPQFRGSGGFGQAFAEAGHGEWGGLIQSDITDGVRSLLETGRVDPERVCVAGWSFGGYSALMQAILEPEIYACAAAGAPVTDLPELLAWKEGDGGEPFDQMRSMLGYPDTELMARYSPARRASEVTIPLIMVHGDDDRIVPVEQSRLMAEALEAAGVEHRLQEFDGGHGLNNPGEMLTAMFHITSFLNEHLDPFYQQVRESTLDGESQAVAPITDDESDQ